MISPEKKPLLKKDIDELRFINHEKQLSIYSSYYKKYRKKFLTKNKKWKIKKIIILIVFI